MNQMSSLLSSALYPSTETWVRGLRDRISKSAAEGERDFKCVMNGSWSPVLCDSWSVVVKVCEVVVVVERWVVGALVMCEGDVVSEFEFEGGARRLRREDVVVVGFAFVELLREGRKKGADLGILGASRGLLRCFFVHVLVSGFWSLWGLEEVIYRLIASDIQGRLRSHLLLIRFLVELE